MDLRLANLFIYFGLVFGAFLLVCLANGRQQLDLFAFDSI